MIDRETMRNLQALSMIHLQEREEQELARQLEQIIDYFSLLSKFDTSETDLDLGSAVEPNQLRQDERRGGVNHGQIEDFAVEFQDGHFIVPRILGDDTHA